jgi:phosphate transport system permease protein
MTSPLLRSLRRGDPLIWLTGSALGVCLLMIAGLVGVILVNGLGFFWPRPLLEVTLRNGDVFLGEIQTREPIPNPGHADHLKKSRIQLRVGNRDLLGFDFKWIDEGEIARRAAPPEAWFIERREYGPLIGTPVLLREGETVRARGPEAVGPSLPALLGKAERDRAAIARIEKGEIGEINYRIERLRLLDRKLDFEAGRDPALDQGRERDRIRRAVEEQKALYATRQEELSRIVELAAPTTLTVQIAGGREKELRTLDIYRAYPANRLGWPGRLGIYTHRLWEFLRDDPRESNTEGGIFPAIFGTVMMVIIMSIIVVPLGVLAALYLREYAKQGALVRTVRIAVNNLAGVPSIVFGVFGLGFFVYFVGGTLDQLFFSAALPTPTYGTGGILWASLTLALLTVPVVIVASEEALAAVPRSMREASVAMGATKLQTILKVVLPAAAPGILTGLILAMARGAGEVAPLMLTGVVKLAPELPLDGFFPFFHLDRKFMHLGFHIYDVGFQSPNVEAAKPMVYTTTILLLVIVVLLNLAAIVVRNRLREKYKTGAF